jgi:hypothetical protein
MFEYMTKTIGEHKAHYWMFVWYTFVWITAAVFLTLLVFEIDKVGFKLSAALILSGIGCLIVHHIQQYIQH